VNQLELEAMACNRRQAAENAGDKHAISFGLTFHLAEKVARVFQTNQSKRKLLSTLS